MQNRYFLDVNILIDLLVNSNYKNVRSSDDVPNLTKSKIKEILSDKDKICVISSNSLVTAFFALTNKNRSLMAHTAELLLKIYSAEDSFIVAYESLDAQIKALEFAKENNADFEDALQYFCAKENGCTTIVTNDKDFPKLEIPLLRTDPKLKNFTPKFKKFKTE